MTQPSTTGRALLETELRVAIEAAKAAGDRVLQMRQEGLRYGRKDGFELVSEADLVAAEMLHAALTGAFPDTGWLSEEHEDDSDRVRRDRVWIVDPIDGTREYLQGIPEYAVSVALAVEGRPALGVVYNPARDEMHAAVCVGAVERESRLLPGKFEVLVGRGEKRLDEVPSLPRDARTRGVGSVAYRLARLAEGDAQAVVTGYGRMEWDIAAGAALCLAAGLRTTDVLGGEIRLNQPDPHVRGLLVAAPPLHRHLREHFERHY